ncbi:hypothetical protein [Halobacteriovorax sp.]|uniref:hypothetical protein n=1 Tax=Halobacteriovorax sp. TaxID=2020862 RepID=UPI00356AF954
MFDDLKEKIDDLVSSIKSKLPGSKSDDDDDDEYEDEEGEFDEKTEEINVAQKVAESEEDEDDDEYEDDDEEDDEDEAKAKKQKVMRLGLVGLVLILGASILMEPAEDDNTVPDVKPIARKKRPKRKKKVVKKETAKAKEEKVKAEATPVEKAPEPEVAEAPKEEISDEQENQVANENTQVVQNELQLVDETPDVDPTSISPIGQEMSDEGSANQPSSLGEESVTQNNQGSTQGSEMSEAIDNLTTTEPSMMIEKVVKEKLEYQEPPNYLETGRGLVYNCTGKHWACVDQVSFVDCKKNSDWSQENNKDPECYPSNVYRSFKDCRTIQLYNINTNLETSFCKK